LGRRENHLEVSVSRGAAERRHAPWRLSPPWSLALGLYPALLRPSAKTRVAALRLAPHILSERGLTPPPNIMPPHCGCFDCLFGPFPLQPILDGVPLPCRDVFKGEPSRRAATLREYRCSGARTKACTEPGASAAVAKPMPPLCGSPFSPTGTGASAPA
jgi:hypothetical protein